MFEKDKWYDQDGTYKNFNGPAKCLNTSYDGRVGNFGKEHNFAFSFDKHFHEVSAPAERYTTTKIEYNGKTIRIPEDAPSLAAAEALMDSEPDHVEKLDQSINDRLAWIKEIDQQIADFLAHCEGGRVEEVIPADTRESIRVIFTRG